MQVHLLILLTQFVVVKTQKAEKRSIKLSKITSVIVANLNNVVHQLQATGTTSLQISPFS